MELFRLPLPEGCAARTRVHIQRLLTGSKLIRKRRLSCRRARVQQPLHEPSDGNDRGARRVDRDVADETVELSPTDWVQAQTSEILETGTTEGIEVLGSPIVLLTLRGAKTGKLRYTPVMRVEHDGRYAVVASKGGAPEHPTWYHNIKAYPEFPLQDGTVTKDYVAREVEGAERAEWWERAVAAYPPYAEYQKKTDRQIPVFVLDSK
jgi:deazaflavin-dependent oxidoreductase (nitroreductase family)